MTDLAMVPIFPVTALSKDSKEVPTPPVPPPCASPRTVAGPTCS